MKKNVVKKKWDQNFSAWKRASSLGFDVWRDHLNTPAFLEMLPDISSAKGLDIGTGEGYNANLLAKYCKQLIGIDICEKQIDYCNNELTKTNDNLSFCLADASNLPFDDMDFDFAVAIMAFMDIPNFEKVLLEIHRVLKPGGFLQFSITHPCFNEFKGRWLEDAEKNRIAFLMKNYFSKVNGEIHKWKHFYAPSDEKFFETPRFYKTLSEWFNVLIGAGFLVEEIKEPYADLSSIEKYPALSSTRVVAHSLMVRARKNG